MKEPILSCQNISLKLNGTSILENVSLDLHPGEFHLLVGENGAGKTSIVNILSGIYSFSSYSGTILFKNKLLNLRTPKDAIKKNIITIHQDTCLYEDLTIAENLYANLPSRTSLKTFVSLEKKIKKANIFFQNHDFAIDSSKLIKQCTPSTKRKIELMKLYLTDPDLLILDEPVSTTSSYDMDYFFQLMTYFKEKGITILCISHNYQAFLPFIDRFSIFQENGSLCTINRNDYQSKDIRDLLMADFCQSRYPKIHIKKGAEVLCVENLSNGESIHDISFTLHKGEILGFFGRADSGKNALPKALFGISPCTNGTIYIDRLPAKISNPREAINLGLAYITDERNEYGLFPNLDLLENVYSIKGNNFDHFWIRSHFEQKRYNTFCQKLNLNLYSGSHPEYLSGGEQQKVILMRWLMSPAKIFIFNEPTQSIDVPSKIDIYNMFNDLILKGSSILVFSSNLEELMGICDRVIFLRQGMISGEVCYKESINYIYNYI